MVRAENFQMTPTAPRGSKACMTDRRMMPEDTGNDGFCEIPGTDGGILKKILREGKGDTTPAPGNMVSVHYTGTLQSDGSKFDR
eukprot:757582-Hanusia_phi.AAC.2